jgi:hypothetical protein
MVERRGDGWGPAIHLDAPVNSDAGEYYPTVAANGNLYFSSSRPGARGGETCTGVVSRPALRSPGEPGRLGQTPRRSTAIHSSRRTRVISSSPVTADPMAIANGDLYVATNRGRAWGAARRLGHGINSEAQVVHADRLARRKWLYFTSYRAAIDEPCAARSPRPSSGRWRTGRSTGAATSIGCRSRPCGAARPHHHSPRGRGCR